MGRRRPPDYQLELSFAGRGYTSRRCPACRTWIVEPPAHLCPVRADRPPGPDEDLEPEDLEHDR